MSTDPLRDVIIEGIRAALPAGHDLLSPDPLIQCSAAADAAAAAIRRLPESPYLAVIRHPHLAEQREAFTDLADRLREHGCVLLLGTDEDTRLELLDDAQLAALGLTRTELVAPALADLDWYADVAEQQAHAGPLAARAKLRAVLNGPDTPTPGSTEIPPAGPQPG